MRSEAAETIRFDFTTPRGAVDLSLDASTDTGCDPPLMVLLDLNGDGREDLYFQHCRGHGYVRRGTPLMFIDLGKVNPANSPVLSTWWFRAVKHGGWPLLPAGATLVLAGVVHGLMARWRSSNKRHCD